MTDLELKNLVKTYNLSGKTSISFTAELLSKLCLFNIIIIKYCGETFHMVNPFKKYVKEYINTLKNTLKDLKILPFINLEISHDLKIFINNTNIPYIKTIIVEPEHITFSELLNTTRTFINIHDLQNYCKNLMYAIFQEKDRCLQYKSENKKVPELVQERSLITIKEFADYIYLNNNQNLPGFNYRRFSNYKALSYNNTSVVIQVKTVSKYVDLNDPYKGVYTEIHRQNIRKIFNDEYEEIPDTIIVEKFFKDIPLDFDESDKKLIYFTYWLL